MTMYDNIRTIWQYHTLEPLKDKPALQVLQRGLEFIDDYWLSAGTLLGLERDNGFIEDDTDLDIAVVGFWDHNRLPSDEFRAGRIVYDGDRLMQSAYVHTATNIVFDVLHWWPHPTDTSKLINIKEDGYLLRSASLVTPTSEATYLGHTFKVPNNLDAYLTEWYDTWRIPKKGAKTQWLQ